MIRPAQPADAPAIAQLILLAMGDALAAKLANSPDREVALQLFERFAAQTGNQYSYSNILVWAQQAEVCGMIMAYNGAQLDELRKPFLHYTRSRLGFTGQPEDETQPGEYYIDCLAVSPAHQGKGIAKKLITALLERAAAIGHHTVGLLVNKGNPKAKKLYIHLGFKVMGDQALLGGVHEHLQYHLEA
ncbi:GNAT family N-acetyltransferase [Mucilaginibacter phyllosphaerae]|uniref:N-acetyltransferase n=1 Tax=Mucilaginibacter phyllosphaerae TaxID=1812349 RepID=A0A4Y8AJW7_9SPHI|nr:N-acetyltransferase [Mucilaginibacter phyllosphaerae]MBB3967641.1 ribosomal protein S18 acetylase RimI-like enzyme [Mucilaginibacter phyllosphaerae]TEW69303.1 N-acetyltransferase [Mucilaginibacter phyllosphaerae]GGH04263.1 N-acetyltransferase [Mucilaginibacter phyllosphaerae]